MWGHADPRSLRAQGAPSQPALYLYIFGLIMHVDGNACQRGTMHPCWEALRSSTLPGRRPWQQAVLRFSLDLCVVFFPRGTQRGPVGHGRSPRAKAAARPCGPGSTSSVNLLGQSLQQRPEPGLATPASRGAGKKNGWESTAKRDRGSGERWALRNSD